MAIRQSTLLPAFWLSVVAFVETLVALTIQVFFELTLVPGIGCATLKFRIVLALIRPLLRQYRLRCAPQNCNVLHHRPVLHV